MLAGARRAQVDDVNQVVGGGRQAWTETTWNNDKVLLVGRPRRWWELGWRRPFRIDRPLTVGVDCSFVACCNAMPVPGPCRLKLLLLHIGNVRKCCFPFVTSHVSDMPRSAFGVAACSMTCGFLTTSPEVATCLSTKRVFATPKVEHNLHRALYHLAEIPLLAQLPFGPKPREFQG